MEQHYKLIVGCDVAAVDFKNEIIRIMRNNQYQITDAGCDNTKDGLYTTIAKKVADAVVAGGRNDLLTGIQILLYLGFYAVT